MIWWSSVRVQQASNIFLISVLLVGVQHDIKYNAAKSVVMICRTKEDKCMTFPDFNLAGDVLRVSSNVLGHWITDQLTDDEDMYRQCHMLYAQANILSRKFS